MGKARLLPHFLISAALLTATASIAAPEAPVDTETAPSYDPVAIRIECARRADKGPHEIAGNQYQYLNAFIDKLAAARDGDALRLIITEELPGFSYAAKCYANLAGPRKGIQFAQTLRLYRAWRSMLWALSSSKSAEVRAYVREAARLGGGLRPFCYYLDMSHGWGDLVEEAWADLDSCDRVGDDLWADYELGDVARVYLDKFEKKRAIPPRRHKPGPGIGPQ